VNVGVVGLLSLLGVPLVAGSAVLAAMGVRRAHDRLAYLGWACLAGHLVVALVMLGALAARLPLRAAWWSPVLLVASLAVHAVARARARPEDDSVATGAGVEPGAAAAATRGPRWERVLFRAVVAAVVARAVFTAILGNLYLVTISDEATIWGSKAWALYQAGSLTAPVPMISAAHWDYPLLNPLLQVWGMANVGGLTQLENRMPLQACFVALLLVAAAALRRAARPALAAALLLLFVTCTDYWDQARGAMSEQLVALGLITLLDAWLRHQERPAGCWLRLACVAAAFLAWSKNEGLFYLALALPCLAAFGLARAGGARRALRDAGAWLALPVAIVAVQWIFNRAHGYTNDIVDRAVVHAGFGHNLQQRLGPVLSAFSEALFTNPRDTQLLVALLLLLALAGGRRLWRSAAAGPVLTVLVATAGLMIPYLVTTIDVDWHLSTSLVRVLTQLGPSAALGVAAALAVLLPWSAPAASSAAAPAR